MDKLKHILDACAAAGACSGIMAFLGYIPMILGVIASLMSVAWYTVQFRDRNKRKSNGD